MQFIPVMVKQPLLNFSVTWSFRNHSNILICCFLLSVLKMICTFMKLCIQYVNTCIF